GFPHSPARVSQTPGRPCTRLRKLTSRAEGAEPDHRGEHEWASCPAGGACRVRPVVSCGHHGRAQHLDRTADERETTQLRCGTSRTSVGSVQQRTYELSRSLRRRVDLHDLVAPACPAYHGDVPGT